MWITRLDQNWESREIDRCHGWISIRDLPSTLIHLKEYQKRSICEMNSVSLPPPIFCMIYYVYHSMLHVTIISLPSLSLSLHEVHLTHVRYPPHNKHQTDLNLLGNLIRCCCKIHTPTSSHHHTSLEHHSSVTSNVQCQIHETSKKPKKKNLLIFHENTFWNVSHQLLFSFSWFLRLCAQCSRASIVFDRLNVRSVCSVGSKKKKKKNRKIKTICNVFIRWANRCFAPYIRSQQILCSFVSFDGRLVGSFRLS